MKPKKLKDIRKEDYKACAAELDEALQNMPILLSLDLREFFQSYSGNMPVIAAAGSCSFTPESKGEPEIYQIGFDVNLNKESQKELVRLLKTQELNRKAVRKLKGYYQYIKGKAPESLEAVWNTYDAKNLLTHLTNLAYDVRFGSRENNLYSFDIYSGVFQKQGLMTQFYENLEKVADFGDLESLKIEDIIQGSTKRMFNTLNDKIPNQAYLCELLKRKYIKSPFMRLFNRLGFRDMTVLTHDGGIASLEGRKSPILKFSIKEDKDW